MKQDNILAAYPAQYLLNKLLESAMIEMRKQEQAELPARQKKVYEVEEDDD